MTKQNHQFYQNYCLHLGGKDCLMANNSKIQYQQCYTSNSYVLRYCFDRKLGFVVAFSKELKLRTQLKIEIINNELWLFCKTFLIRIYFLMDHFALFISRQIFRHQCVTSFYFYQSTIFCYFILLVFIT